MSALGSYILIVQTGFHQPQQKRAQSFNINCGYPCRMLRLLEGNGLVTYAQGNCFISELQSKRKHATVWIKIRFMKMSFKHHGKKSRKHMMEDENQGLKHDEYECGSGWLAQSEFTGQATEYSHPCYYR